MGMSGGDMNLDEAIRELYYSKYQNNDNFHSMLYRLIAKADPSNRRRLSVGFPAEVLAYTMWLESENEKEFFEKYLGKNNAGI